LESFVYDDACFSLPMQTTLVMLHVRMIFKASKLVAGLFSFSNHPHLHSPLLSALFDDGLKTKLFLAVFIITIYNSKNTTRHQIL
jgi:hypothetical protein